MKTIGIITAFLLLSFTAYAQNVDKMQTYQDEYGYIFLEESSNFRTRIPHILKLDGTPYPGWKTFGFEAIHGYNPVYRAFKEVLTTAQINSLVATGKKIYVGSRFNLEGNTLEVEFSFSDSSGYDVITSVISMDNFYEIAQKIKQYDKYRILEDLEDLDVQWLGGFFTFTFDKVRDWQP